MRKLGTIMAIILLTVVLGFTIPTPIGAISGLESTEAGEIAVVRDGGSSTTTGSGRSSIPASGLTWTGLWSDFTPTPRSSASTRSPPTPSAPPPSASTS